MEEESSAIKRRNIVTAPVIIPPNLEPLPSIKPRKSSSINGHYRLLPSSSSSTSTSSTSSVYATADFDLTSFKSSPMSYTSLKDIIAASPVLSPTTPSAVAASPGASSPGGASNLEISIRNRLVKQAAWAYLQPVASSPSASGRRLCSGFTGDFIKPFWSSIKRVFVEWAARACNWLADALWLLLCR